MLAFHYLELDMARLHLVTVVSRLALTSLITTAVVDAGRSLYPRAVGTDRVVQHLCRDSAL